MFRITTIFLLSFLIPISAEPLDTKTHPISVSVKKTAEGKYNLLLELPQNYGFQKDAPHRILLSTKGNLSVKKADLTFNGPTHPKKPEYYEYLKAMPLALEGKGSLEVNGKIFYCNFMKNICIPGKISEILDVP